MATKSEWMLRAQRREEITDEVMIEHGRSIALWLVKRLRISDRDRKSAILFLAMTKPGRFPQRWMRDELRNAIMYPDIDPDTGEEWTPIE